jgi:hypothetical protein
VIGRLHSLVLDCPEPRTLAEFYSELLGLPRLADAPRIIIDETPRWTGDAGR